MATLKKEIAAILNDASISRSEKGKKIAGIVQSMDKVWKEILPVGIFRLKHSIKQEAKPQKVLSLSIYKEFFDAIRNGIKKAEYREVKEYYIDKCTYEEGGTRYIVPYDAIRFFVGRGKDALRMTVRVRDITCNGTYFIFHLGKVVE